MVNNIFRHLQFAFQGKFTFTIFIQNSDFIRIISKSCAFIIQ